MWLFGAATQPWEWRSSKGGIRGSPSTVQLGRTQHYVAHKQALLLPEEFVKIYQQPINAHVFCEYQNMMIKVHLENLLRAAQALSYVLELN